MHHFSIETCDVLPKLILGRMVSDSIVYWIIHYQDYKERISDYRRIENGTKNSVQLNFWSCYSTAIKKRMQSWHSHLLCSIIQRTINNASCMRCYSEVSWAVGITSSRRNLKVTHRTSANEFLACFPRRAQLIHRRPVVIDNGKLLAIHFTLNLHIGACKHRNLPTNLLILLLVFTLYRSLLPLQQISRQGKL